MQYKLEDILPFEKYKNEEVRFVYTFDPEYIEWLIINNDYFTIDIDDFKDMHTCQMNISGVTSDERFGFVTVKVKGEAEFRTLSLREYLKEFYTDEYELNYVKIPKTVNKHIFSEKALIALEKKEYILIANKWNKEINKIIVFYKENPIYFKKYKFRLDNYQREIAILSKDFSKNKEQIALKIFEFSKDIGVGLSISAIKNTLSNEKISLILCHRGVSSKGSGMVFLQPSQTPVNPQFLNRV